MGWFDDHAQQLGIDPSLMDTGGQMMPPDWQHGGTPLSADTGFLATGDANPAVALAGSPGGQQAPGGTGASLGNKSWLAWINDTYGQSKARGGGFADLPQGVNLQQAVQRFNQDTGANAQYLGGHSGDQVDFGRGAEDVMTAGGQLWQANDPSDPTKSGGGSYAGGGGGNGQPSYANYGGYGGQSFDNGGGWAPGAGPGGGANPAMPTAPTVTDLKTPGPFNYPSLGDLGRFQSPGQVPGQQQLGYNPVNAPGDQQAQQVGAPQQLGYQAMQTPQAFQGNRQADPGQLQAQGLNTPGAFQTQSYNGLTAADLAADPSYQFRLKQGLDTIEQSAAGRGMLRTGGTGKALIDYGQQAASQEYAAADARARQTNQQNNSNQLAGYQTNAQTGLNYNQNANQNALQFGQANIGNQFNTNEANYGRGSQEAQQAFQNQFNTTNTNNSNALGFGQANISNAMNATQANNAANLAYGGQNFQQGFAANQANNQGQNAATQQNNANALAAQGQQFGQSLGGYQANLGAQNQGYNQGIGAYGLNAQTGLQYGAQNQQNQLANYQAQTNAALGLGNLNLGYTNAANQYSLGQQGINLGYQNSNNAYSLGQGQLGLGQGQLDLSRSFGTYDRNYQSQVTDPWNQQYQLSQLGKPK